KWPQTGSEHGGRMELGGVYEFPLTCPALGNLVAPGGRVLWSYRAGQHYGSSVHKHARSDPAGGGSGTLAARRDCLLGIREREIRTTARFGAAETKGPCTAWENAGNRVACGVRIPAAGKAQELAAVATLLR